VKIIYKNIVWVLLIGLVITNIYLFVSGISLADKINFFENETRKIHQQNIALENETSYFDSISYAASMAAVLDFVKPSSPIYLENLKYALNR